MHEVHLEESDFFPGIQITRAELLGHLDYLNQTQYIKAEFTGNAYANQEDVPSAVEAKEFDFRVITLWLIRWASASLDYLQSGRTHGKRP